MQSPTSNKAPKDPPTPRLYFIVNLRNDLTELFRSHSIFRGESSSLFISLEVAKKVIILIFETELICQKEFLDGVEQDIERMKSNIPGNLTKRIKDALILSFRQYILKKSDVFIELFSQFERLT